MDKIKNSILLIVAGALTFSAFPTLAKRLPLERVDLFPVPLEMCGFQFRDMSTWSIEKTHFSGNCDTEMVLRYMDGSKHRWASIEEVDMGGHIETITTNPRPRILLSFHPGKITQNSHEVSFLVGLSDSYGLTFEREGTIWVSHGHGYDEVSLSMKKGFHILEGEGSIRGRFDSGHYYASLGGRYTIVDNGQGTLMTISRGEDNSDDSRKKPWFMDQLKAAVNRIKSVSRIKNVRVN